MNRRSTVARRLQPSLVTGASKDTSLGDRTATTLAAAAIEEKTVIGHVLCDSVDGRQLNDWIWEWETRVSGKQRCKRFIQLAVFDYKIEQRDNSQMGLRDFVQNKSGLVSQLSGVLIAMKEHFKSIVNIDTKSLREAIYLIFVKWDTAA